MIVLDQLQVTAVSDITLIDECIRPTQFHKNPISKKQEHEERLLNNLFGRFPPEKCLTDSEKDWFQAKHPYSDF